MDIVFLPSSEDAQNYVPAPKPAKLYVPEWYKSIRPIKESELKFNEKVQVTNLNVKHCMPYFDALTGGYIQELWTDILIEPTEDGINFKCAVDPVPIAIRERVSVKIDEGFYPVEFLWQRQWGTKLPKGYSMLVTHPLNRVDLPFQTLSAVVDADSFIHHDVGNIPFFIRSGFKGIIPAGTPIYQIFPYKRDDWFSSFKTYNEIEKNKFNKIIRGKFLHSYRDKFWNKKTFN